MRTRLIVGLVLTVAVLAVAGLLFGGRLAGEEPASGADSEERTGTDTVERRTLVDRETVEGTFGYGGDRAVINHLGEGAGGGGADVAWDGGDAMTYFASDEAPAAGDEDEDEDDECEDADEEDSGQRTTDSGNDADSEDDDEDCDDDKDDDDTKNDDGKNSGGNDDNEPPSGGTPRNGAPSGGTDTPSSSGGSPTAGDGGGDGNGGGGDGGATDSNTLTSTARAGTVVRRGGVLYRVDDDAVVLMYGDTPAWRDMEPGIAKGRDVAQLEQNLKKLGYTDDGFEPDGTYDSTTAAAVRRWQEDKGLPKTGTVEHGRVVFMAGARRAGTRTADIGQSLTDGVEVMKTTSTTRLVKVELEVSKQSIVKEGDPVTVTLPGGRTAKGRIRSVGRVAHTPDSDDSGGAPDDNGGGSDPVIDMTVALSSTKGLNRFDEAPVSVNIARETRKQALSVPVTALLAQAGGGYAVEVVGSDGTKQLREVEPGLYAGGYVEIAEGSVREGDRVTVPAE